jgi:transcription elongation GreA/GreB family factor
MADGNDELPFVIFNCIVQLASESGEDWSCCITLPKAEYENALSSINVTPIPCNSPHACALMFKQCGESVVIEKNETSETYIVKGIELNPFIPLDRNET